MNRLAAGIVKYRLVFVLLFAALIGFAVSHRGEMKLPGLRCLRRREILPGRKKFHKMAVAGSSQYPETPEQIHFYAVPITERIMPPVIRGNAPLFTVSAFKEALHEVRQQGKNVGIPIACFRDPGEVVDPGGVDHKFMTIRTGNAKLFLQNTAEEIFCVEYFMAAAESPDPGKNIEKSFAADRHRVGEIDDPGIRTAAGNCPGKLLIDGHRPHGTKDTARPYGITYRLPDAERFRGMDIGVHFIKRPGKDGTCHKISACERFVKGRGHRIIPSGEGIGMFVDPSANRLVSACGFLIDIVEGNLTGKVFRQGKVIHKDTCPGFGAAPDISKFDVFHGR